MLQPRGDPFELLGGLEDLVIGDRMAHSHPVDATYGGGESIERFVAGRGRLARSPDAACAAGGSGQLTLWRRWVVRSTNVVDRG